MPSVQITTFAAEVEFTSKSITKHNPNVTTVLAATRHKDVANMLSTATAQPTGPWDSQYKTFTPMFHNVLGCSIILVFLSFAIPKIFAYLRSDPHSKRKTSNSGRYNSKSINDADAENRPLLGNPSASTSLLVPDDANRRTTSRSKSQVGITMEVNRVQALLNQEIFNKQTASHWIIVIFSIAALVFSIIDIYARRAVFQRGNSNNYWHNIAFGVAEPVYWVVALILCRLDRMHGRGTRTFLQVFWVLHFAAITIRFYDLHQDKSELFVDTNRASRILIFLVPAVIALTVIVDVVRERKCELFEINAEAKLLDKCRRLVRTWVDSGTYEPADGDKHRKFMEMTSHERQRASEQYVAKNLNGMQVVKLLYWMVMKVDAPIMILGICGSIMAALGSVLLPLAVGKATDAAAHAMYQRDQTTLDEINTAGKAFILPLVMIGVGQFINGAFVEVSGTRVVCRVQRLVFVSICRQDASYFDKNKVGEITSLLQTNVQMLRGGMTTALANSLKGLLQFILGIIFMIHGVHGGKGSPKLFGIVLGLGMPAVVAICILMKAGTHFAKVMTDRSQKSGGVATEMISSIKMLFTFNLENYAEKKYSKAVRHTMAAGIQKDVLQGSMMGITYASWMSATTLTWYFGGHMIYNKEIDMKYLATFISLISQVLGGFMAIFGLLPAMGAAVGAATTLFKPILQCPSINDSFSKGLQPPSAHGNVQLSKVNFSYPTRDDIQVLSEFDLAIEAGKSVAIVGSSGSGKSTVLQLIERFYDTNSGAVKIDGNDVKDVDVEWLRDTIGVVMQEPKLLSGTVGENIALGKMDATQADIEAAAKLANAHDFILGQPDGYNTKVGEGGATLSGGQRQRIAIARAVIKDPRILLLDEATSALDSTAEIEVQKALETVAQGRTTLTVAHRRSAIAKADIIYVVNNGQIVERGTFDELMQTGEVFQGLYGNNGGY